MLKLNKSIFGANDAARAWYLELVDFLLRCGWIPAVVDVRFWVRPQSANLVGDLPRAPIKVVRTKAGARGAPCNPGSFEGGC